MALSMVTNTSSLMVRSNLNAATASMNTAIERMTTGFKVNRAKDDAAGLNIIDTMTAKIGSFEVATDNAQIGLDMLTTAEENYGVITGHLQRIRELTEQAANETYSTDSLLAIRAEIKARLDEIDRVAAVAEYNGLFLMNGDLETNGVVIQVGLYGETDDKITLDGTLFKGVTSTALIAAGASDNEGLATSLARIDDTGAVQTDNCSKFLTKMDTAIKDIATRVTNLGAAQNRLESAMESIQANIFQLTNSRMSMRDADVAEESTNFIQAQILQSAAGTLLSTANQTPSIALQLI